jgi:hypothetical protein
VSDDTDDFFDDKIDEVERQNGEPLIIQPDGTRRAYTRASSLGDFLADNSFLTEWQLCNLAVALGRRPDLADMCAVEPYTTGFAEPEARIKSASKKRLMGIIERLLDSVRISERADRGTVVHAVTEQDYDGYVPVNVLTEHAAFLEWLAINNVTRVGSEIFVVNDELKVAGTFDHLFYIEGFGLIIGDTKNGRNQNNLGFACQFANYSRSKYYDIHTGERIDLAEYVKSRFHIDAPEGVNQDVALLLNVKAAFDGGIGEVKVSEVDIQWGYEQCKLAAAVRDARKQESGKVLQSKILKHVKGAAAKKLAHKAIVERLWAATSHAELAVIWKQYKKIWTDDMTLAARGRRDQLGEE